MMYMYSPGTSAREEELTAKKGCTVQYSIEKRLSAERV